MSKVIKVENLSKSYQLGDFGTGTISRDLERFWARIRGKEDPFLRIGEVNDRTVKGVSDIVWGLKDINFEVNQGDAVGIIGRNGAGKSTLLKVLSRVTSPTTGSVKVKGRITSLLEVGTGFHPELTGRENIYLNGAILGMRKNEIKRKFDEIVDFSGVERYIDTPVKRYSSGMYVRLAFAVAAHLESEILIVDEVLAVGDAEFQKKCLGKMGDISGNEGKTVLFVSHNIHSISALCDNTMLLKNGALDAYDRTNTIINKYLSSEIISDSEKVWPDLNNAPGNEIVKMLAIKVINDKGEKSKLFDVAKPIIIVIKYQVFKEGYILWHGLNLHNDINDNIFDTHSVTSEWYNKKHPIGIFSTKVTIPGNFLAEGRITVGVAIFNHKAGQIHFHITQVVSFEVIDHLVDGIITARGNTMGIFPGIVRPLLKWESE